MKQTEIIEAGNIAHKMLDEVIRARSMYPPFNSPHEGYAVLLEEVEELWQEVKKKHKDADLMRQEAIQIGAMAIRFVQDSCKDY